MEDRSMKGETILWRGKLVSEEGDISLLLKVVYCLIPSLQMLKVVHSCNTLIQKRLKLFIHVILWNKNQSWANNLVSVEKRIFH